MKTAFLSASLSSRAGGIFEIERRLASNLSDLGVSIEAYGIWDERWEQDRHLWGGLPCNVFKHIGLEGYTFSPALKSAFMGAEFDLIHLHHLWMYPSWLALQRHKQRGEPYIVTPNGMLEPWSLRSAAWKKRLIHMLHESRMLRNAACLQANTEKELQDFCAYGLKNPVCIIPNGVDLPQIGDQGVGVREQESETRGRIPETGDRRRILLFLGRLHPKKGLVNALRAWAQIRSQGAGGRGHEEWTFAIAGWDQGGHEAELKRLCDELGIAYSETPASEFINLSPYSRPLTPVTFAGPAFGATKDALLRQAHAFILPSFSEGLPMSVLEAWSYQLPVLMTDHCNIPEGFSAYAAIRIGTDVESIAEGMRQILQSTIPDLQSIGRNGRSLVERHFTWPQVAAQMKEVYEWMLGGGTPPDCVRQI